MGDAMLRTLCALLVCLCACGPAFAAPVLFGPYERGAARSALSALPGMTSLPENAGKGLLLPGVAFAGHTWTAQFHFDEGQTLIGADLMAPYARSRFDAVRQRLEADGFELLGVVVDGKALDLFSLIKAEGVEAFRTRFLELMRAQTPRRVSYAWFDTKNVSEDQKKMATSLNEFLRMVDRNIRQADVVQLGDESSAGPRALLVSFTCPVLDAVPYVAPDDADSASP